MSPNLHTEGDTTVTVFLPWMSVNPSDCLSVTWVDGKYYMNTSVRQVEIPTKMPKMFSAPKLKIFIQSPPNLSHSFYGDNIVKDSVPLHEVLKQ